MKSYFFLVLSLTAVFLNLAHAAEFTLKSAVDFSNSPVAHGDPLLVEFETRLNFFETSQPASKKVIKLVTWSDDFEPPPAEKTYTCLTTLIFQIGTISANQQNVAKPLYAQIEISRPAQIDTICKEEDVLEGQSYRNIQIQFTLTQDEVALEKFKFVLTQFYLPQNAIEARVTRSSNHSYVLQIRQSDFITSVRSSKLQVHIFHGNEVGVGYGEYILN